MAGTLADGVLPSTSGYLSDEAKALLIEKFTGKVDKAFISMSIMAGFLPVLPVIGTDTISVRRFGNTKPRRVTPGVRPGGDGVDTDKITLTISTHILFRNFFSQLGEVQQDIDMTGMTSQNHGENMAKLFDKACLIMAYRGSKTPISNTGNSNVTDHTLNGAFFDGMSVSLDAAGDELDPDKLVDKMDELVTEIKNRDMPLEGFAFFVRPSTYKLLCDHPKLLNQDFSQGNGNYAWRQVKVLGGVPIVETSRIMSTPNDELSTLFNSKSYIWSQDDCNVQAILFHRDGLLIGESLVEASNIFYSDIEKTWVVDTDRAFDIGIRNPGLCYSMNKTAASIAAIKQGGNSVAVANGEYFKGVGADSAKYFVATAAFTFGSSAAVTDYSGKATEIVAWEASTPYAVGSLVTNASKIYKCSIAHTSATSIDTLRFNLVAQ